MGDDSKKVATEADRRKEEAKQSSGAKKPKHEHRTSGQGEEVYK
jgi:hypothetical protein